MQHLGTKKLYTDRLILRRFYEEDAKELCFGFINQDEFLYYANKLKKTIEEQRKMLKTIAENYLKNNYYNWVITLKENKTIIGSINLKMKDNDSVEFNYAIDNRYTGNGYMTEALNEVKRFCIKEVGVKKLMGGCCVENTASKRVMEKCGLRLERIEKNYIELSDGFHDAYMYSIE